ncbi:hypothetical protein [Psychromicrobium xiongbiense]|uniref:hypothetical protein n=1 Tax=Psychromicrobium xiongbiense TaxID=3051184 RepID=UPI002554461C|nr:hypothetical protein [Psychromicrobium sp. YIM S02556]
MHYARIRLIGYGALALVLGVVLLEVSTQVSGLFVDALRGSNNTGLGILTFFLDVLNRGVIPLGASMLAMGIALWLVERGKAAEAAAITTQDPADGQPAKQ